MNAVLLYLDKYRYLAYLVVVTGLVYFAGSVIVEVTAQLRPSVKTIVIEKRIEHKDVHIHKETVYLPGGITKTTETLIDRTRTEAASEAHKDQKPMLAGGTAGKGKLFLGAGRNADDRWHASVGATYGPVLVTAQTDVYSTAQGRVPDQREYRLTGHWQVLSW